MKNITDQELFWAGDFGNEYINRNNSDRFLASNLSFFSKILKNIERPKNLIEFGANIGMNLKAIKSLLPEIELHGIEINKKASSELSNSLVKRIPIMVQFMILNRMINLI